MEITRSILCSLKKDNRGFSMLELLVVLVVMITLTAIVMSNYGYQNNNLKLKMEVQQIMSDLRKAQNYSISTKMVDTDIPKGGYGVRFERIPNSYTIFADTDANKVYTNIGEKYEQFTLPQGILICQLKVDSNIQNSFDLVFLPPDPKTYIDSQNTVGRKAEIYITVKGGNCGSCPSSECQRINIYSSGIIENK